jgi:polyisoprenyl-phosphate glycosyltransferase
MNNIEISLVVPVYNEEENIDSFVNTVTNILEKIDQTYEIIFILDPSSDDTENKILTNIKKNENVKLILLSRKFGQPIATIAGIEHCNGNYCVIIDGDMQDPPELIEEMYKKIKNEKLDVVYAVRKTRKGETFIKEIVANLGYKLINKLSDFDIPKNTGDFRIISKRVINELKKFDEKEAFLRGLVSYIGFKQKHILFDRKERAKGISKYNKYYGSFKIGINGIVGFSSKPLFFMTIIGFFLALLSFLLGVWYFIQKLTGDNLTPGLTTTVILISFYSGIQLFGLGLLGEYVGRIYEQVNKRPKYILDKKINFNQDKID